MHRQVSWAEAGHKKNLEPTLIKKKIKFSSYIRKFRVEQLQNYIWLTASSYIGKYLPISSYIRKPFLIYDFATAPLWISLYIRKIWFYFLSVYDPWAPEASLTGDTDKKSGAGIYNLWNSLCGIQGADEKLPRQPRNGGRVQELGRSQMANEPNLSKNNPGTGVGSKGM